MPEQLPEGQMVFTLVEVAHHLKTTTWTLRRWIKDRDLQAHKVGQQWRVGRDEVQRKLGTCTARESSTETIVMPDDEHGVRRPWAGLMESRDMVEFVELRLLKMTLDEEDRDARKALMRGFTTRELHGFNGAVGELKEMIEAVLEQRQSDRATDITETPL